MPKSKQICKDCSFYNTLTFEDAYTYYYGVTTSSKYKKAFILFEKPTSLEQFNEGLYYPYIQPALQLNKKNMEFTVSSTVKCNYAAGTKVDKKEVAHKNCNYWKKDLSISNIDILIASGQQALDDIVELIESDSPTPKDIFKDNSYLILCKKYSNMPYKIKILGKTVDFYIIPHYFQIVKYFSAFGGQKYVEGIVSNIFNIMAQQGTRKKAINYHIINSYESLNSAKKYFHKVIKSGSSKIALDIETYNLDYSTKTNKIRCIGLHIKEETFIIPTVGRYGSKVIEEDVLEEALEFLKKLFSNGDLSWIAHNSNFDFTLIYLIYKLFPKGKIEDNMLIAHLYDETQFLDAKSLMKKHVPNVPLNYEDVVHTQAGTGKSAKWYSVIDEDLWEYCAWDTFGEYHTYFPVWDLLKDDTPANLYINIVRPINKILIQGSMLGIPINVRKANQALNASFLKSSDLEAQLKDYSLSVGGPEEFNPGSTPQLSNIIYNLLKYPVLKTTDKGNPSTEMEVITELLLEKNRHRKFLEMYVEYKQLVHTQNNYLRKFCTMSDYFGFIHPRFKTNGARETGRVTSAEPPMVNLPRQGDIKSLVEAPKGYSFIYADYSQCEYALFAFFIQEPALMDELKKGADFHDLTARAMFGKLYTNAKEALADFEAQKFTKKYTIADWEHNQSFLTSQDYDKLSGKISLVKPQKLSNELRVVSKSCNFGIIYGAKPATTARGLGIPVEQVDQFLEILFNKFPAIRKFLDIIPKLAKSQKQITTPFGRRKRFKGEFGNHERNQALNVVFQSGAQDVLSRTCVRIKKKFDEEGIDGRFANMVYDSFLYLVKDEDIERATVFMRDILSIPVREFGNLVLRADLGTGKTWLDADINAKP